MLQYSIKYADNLVEYATRTVSLAVDIFSNFDELIELVESVVFDNERYKQISFSTVDMSSKYHVFLNSQINLSEDDLYGLHNRNFSLYWKVMSQPNVKAKVRSKDDELFLMHLCVMHLHIVTCNSFKSYLYGGIFLLSNHINHSCAPNLLYHKSGNKIVCHTLRPIKIDDQLFIKYRNKSDLNYFDFDQMLNEVNVAVGHDFDFVCRCEICGFSCRRIRRPNLSNHIASDSNYEYLVNEKYVGDSIKGIDFNDIEKSVQLFRSFDHIFEAMSVTSGIRYLPLVSYLEIYNENIRDLLNFSIPSSKLVLKEQPQEGVVVQNLSTHAVHSAEECEQLLTIGTKNRMVGATLMNAGSSRSHSIFIINLEQITTSDGSSTGGDDIATIKKGKLNLVDLAGSERQAKTGATGDRLKEATKINLLLSALGNVISALVDSKSKHIPYRDSKLTRLLQDSLGGNTKTIMIACITPAEFNYNESLSTLRYASRAKNTSNNPVINEDPKDAC